MAEDKNEPGVHGEHRSSPETTINLGKEFAEGLAALENGVSAEEQEAISSLPSGSALLVVRTGPTAGARFLLDSDVASAGRHPNADIFLDDVTVSRQHVEFTRAGTVFSVTDLGSMNGTYRDGERIDGTVELAEGDVVQVGKFRLTFFPARVDSRAKARG